MSANMGEIACGNYKNNNLAVSSKFNIPDLKVGTLDVLVGLSDELAKLDAFVEGVVKKVAQYMADVLRTVKIKFRRTCWPMELTWLLI